VFLLALGNAQGQEAKAVTPIEKVITLLSDLKDSVAQEAKDEAAVYDKFSCFCKDKTEDKSTAITEGNDGIDSDSATIGEKTAELVEKQNELAAEKKKIESLKLEIAAAEAQRAKEKAEYEKVIADLEKALASMAKAIEALEASKPTDLIEVRKIIRRSVALADVLDLNPKHRRAVAALLQSSESEDPESEYDFHSQGIIDLIKELEGDFTKNKEEKDEEETKAVKAHEFLMGEKNVALKDAESRVTELDSDIAALKEVIADTKAALVEKEAELKDNQLYLKDLTARCELKAKEWDQRSQMRADEIEAITQALGVIEGKALGVEADRALLQNVDKAMLQVKDAGSTDSGAVAKDISDHRALDIQEDDVGDLGVDFLQVQSANEMQAVRARAKAFLDKVKDEKVQDVSVASLEARKQKALEIIASEGRRIGSAILMSTALKLGPDPFKKVKVLIQALIERILQEMADEAGHKGFCDTELGKARTSRDFEHEKTQKLSAKLQKLEVDKATFEENIVTLTAELADLNDALEKANKLRADENESNMSTIKDSKEGLEAIKEAIQILKEFYKKAAKAFVQVHASPIDEEGENPGEVAGGSYKGQQKKAEGIIGMLEVIASDFERSIKQTGDQEDESHRSHVAFDRESKGSISTKETAKSQAESDLKETKIAIKEAMSDLEESQKLLDDNLKAIEELKPACIDTGMSYEERVAKREEEIKALGTALCQLDVEGVEADCPFVG